MAAPAGTQNNVPVQVACEPSACVELSAGKLVTALTNHGDADNTIAVRKDTGHLHEPGMIVSNEAANSQSWHAPCCRQRWSLHPLWTASSGLPLLWASSWRVVKSSFANTYTAVYVSCSLQLL